jgi:hypothetical protein
MRHEVRAMRKKITLPYWFFLLLCAGTGAGFGGWVSLLFLIR